MWKRAARFIWAVSIRLYSKERISFTKRCIRHAVLVHDDQTRDLPVFFKKCPAFDPKMLDVKVMEMTTPWLPQKKRNSAVSAGSERLGPTETFDLRGGLKSA